MAKLSRENIDIEADRLKLIHEQRKLLAKSLKEPPAVKKGNFLPGEEHKNKNLAIFLKLAQPRVSYTEIAAQIGETKTTVKRWFADDPYVREQYQWLLHNITEAGLEYLRTYMLEAVATLVTLMRFGSEKYMLEAAKEILDRGGLTKVLKQEVNTNRTETHTWDDSFVEKIKELPEDLQEQAASMLEEVETFLSKADNSSNGSVDAISEDEVDDGA